MAGIIATQRTRHTPLVLVETENLSRDEWLAYRHRGIGGSDATSIFGISPFRTTRDLYFDKLNIASAEEDEGNWVAMEMGNLLETLVAKIFAKKTGYKIYKIKKMFYHPQYPFMLADVDYFMENLYELQKKYCSGQKPFVIPGEPAIEHIFRSFIMCR